MADAQASGACYGNIVWVQVPSPASQFHKGSARKCRNWQTSKTKDLVVDTPCGFKSHLPHKENGHEMAVLFLYASVSLEEGRWARKARFELHEFDESLPGSSSLTKQRMQHKKTADQ